MGILKEGFSPYSSPTMLIGRKLTKDKRVVTDFRHLIVRIAKNNLACPLVKDMFSVLGNSKYEVLSVLDLKDAFHSLSFSENSKRYCGILPYFGSPSYLYQRMPMGLNISPSIWQSHINVILDCLQSRKYCEAIMDDLLLFTSSKESHMKKLEDFLKALLKNGLKIFTKEMSIVQDQPTIHGKQDFYSGQKSVCATLKKQTRGNSKTTTSKNSKRMQKFCRYGEFSEYVMPRFTETH